MKKSFCSLTLALGLFATTAVQGAPAPLPFNETFEAVTGADQDPFLSSATGVISNLPNWIMRSGNAQIAIPSATEAGFFLDFASGAALPAAAGGAVPGAAKAMKADFDSAPGPELTTNGSFATDATGWTLGAGWTYANGAVTYTNPGAAAAANLDTAAQIAVLANTPYNVTFTISGLSGTNSVRAFLGTTAVGAARTADGTYNATAVNSTAGNVTFSLIPQNTNAGSFTIDDITVTQETDSFVQQLVSPTYSATRAFTAKAKFAVLEKFVKNDIRFGVHFLAGGANQQNFTAFLKIGQGEVGTMDKADLEMFVPAFLTANTGINPWGKTREDDTDYQLNVWNTAEWSFVIPNGAEGKMILRVNGKRFPAVVPIKSTISDANLAAGVRFNFASWYNAQGTALFDDLEIVDGVTNYPEAQVLDGATPVAYNTAVDLGKVPIGSTATRTLTIKNLGAADLTTSNLQVTGDFALATGETLAATIPVGGEDTVVVQMPTAALGLKSGVLTFSSNDIDWTMNLAGEVSAATAVKQWEQY